MSVQIRCGPASTPISEQWVGQNVGMVRRALANELGIPMNAPATVSHNGRAPVRVNDDYAICSGDIVEFIRSPGAKGR